VCESICMMIMARMHSMNIIINAERKTKGLSSLEEQV
jgi:hypothetical protein